MNVSPVIVTRIVFSLAALCAMLTTAAPAAAQGGGWAVSIQRNGRPLTPNQVVLHAASEPKAAALAGNVASFAADVITASLEGKQVAAYVDECEDGRIDVHLVPNDGAQPLPEQNSCRRRRLGGMVLLHRGSTALLDIDRGTFVNEQNTANQVSSGRGLGFGVFGTIGGVWTGVDVESQTVGVISDRFNMGSPPYDRYSVDVEDRDSGVAWGGGVDLSFGSSPFGARVGFQRESKREVPEQSVEGERMLGGLRFQQTGTAEMNASTMYFGPTLTLPGGFVLTGGAAVTFWDVQLRQQAQLQIACPQPCVTVQTDDNTENSSGTDIGYHLGADFFPGDGKFGVKLKYLRAIFNNAYDPSRPLGYPSDWKNSVVYAGVVLRTGFWR